MSRVLVTGGSGCIGRNALAPLRDRGYEVHASGSREADLQEPGTAARLIEELRPTHLLHFAWDARPEKYWTSTENLQWAERSLRLLLAFAEGGGPHEQPGWLASSASSALVRGEPAETSAGTQVRDFMHSEDLGDAFATLMDSEVQCAVNMASGEPRPIRDLAVALAEAAGRPDLLRIGARPSNPSELASITAAVERLRDEVGWRGGRTLEQGVDTIAWCRRAVRAL